MSEQFILISNNKISVGYMPIGDAVVVKCTKTENTKFFGGWDDIKNSFDLFVQSFGYTTSFQDACDFFKPNIQPVFINK